MILSYNGKEPKISKKAFIAPNATIIGDVTIEEDASIWFGAVLRGDTAPIHVGARSSIQDNCVVHVSDSGTYVGEDVTVGHGAILHNCNIGNSAVIGMNTVVLDYAKIGDETVIAAGSTVVNNTIIPPRVVAAGSPAEVKKEIKGESLRWVQESSKFYQELKENYLIKKIGGEIKN